MTATRIAVFFVSVVFFCGCVEEIPQPVPTIPPPMVTLPPPCDTAAFALTSFGVRGGVCQYRTTVSGFDTCGETSATVFGGEPLAVGATVEKTNSTADTQGRGRALAVDDKNDRAWEALIAADWQSCAIAGCVNGDYEVGVEYEPELQECPAVSLELALIEP